MIGLNLNFAAFIAESTNSIPCFLNITANSTIKIAFLADNPTKVINATWKYMSLLSPRKYTAKIAPNIANGTATNLTVYPQIELGSDSTDYEAYVDTSEMDVDAPVTLEYIASSEESPTTLTMN